MRIASGPAGGNGVAGDADAAGFCFEEEAGATGGVSGELDDADAARDLVAPR